MLQGSQGNAAIHTSDNVIIIKRRGEFVKPKRKHERKLIDNMLFTQGKYDKTIESGRGTGECMTGWPVNSWSVGR